jgi:hypothetical protein
MKRDFFRIIFIRSFLNLTVSNIFYKIIKSQYFLFVAILPHHDPEFIYELLSMGKYNLVECIFREMMRSLISRGYVIKISKKINFLQITINFNRFLRNLQLTSKKFVNTPKIRPFQNTNLLMSQSI